MKNIEVELSRLADYYQVSAWDLLTAIANGGVIWIMLKKPVGRMIGLV
jgi:hypothetical protein